ncbi:MAG: hypothetical protein ACYS21_16500, partial [Planctomycetota bacterium]
GGYKKKTPSNIQLPDVFRRGEKLFVLFCYRQEPTGDFSQTSALLPLIFGTFWARKSSHNLGEYTKISSRPV